MDHAKNLDLRNRWQRRESPIPHGDVRTTTSPDIQLPEQFIPAGSDARNGW